MKTLKPLLLLFMVLLCAALLLVYLLPLLRGGKNEAGTKGGKEMLEVNYGKEIEQASQEFGIPSSYLKALCMLECNGVKPAGSRFEPHVYRRLKKVRSGQLNSYEHVTADMLQDANDEALRNLASSWGPFQLMGYKCLLLGIKVRDIRGDNAVYHGVKWIDMTYGERIRKGKFRDAFHIHNTGQPFPGNGKPLTYDPAYCRRGLEYMKYFEGR